MAYLEDGYRTLISFSGIPGIHLLEKEVTPFGLDGGDRIDVTTMRNNTVRTYAPQGLIEATEMNLTCAYDPLVLNELLSIINIGDLIFVTHSDGSSWEFYGYLKSAIPNSNTIGEQPTMAVVIVPMNRVPSTGVESVPVYLNA